MRQYKDACEDDMVVQYRVTFVAGCALQRRLVWSLLPTHSMNTLVLLETIESRKLYNTRRAAKTRDPNDREAFFIDPLLSVS